jgi:hypothetical protein
VKTYIGSKIIQGEPEEKDGKPGYKVKYPGGYTSWSPKAVFEEAYRPLNDGEAQMAAASPHVSEDCEERSY